MKNTILGVVILVAIGIAYINMPWQWRRHKDIERGNALIQKLEQYQQQNHRLPDSHEQAILSEIGFIQNKQGWQPAYQKLDNARYQIIYQDGYDAPYLTWQSDKKTWMLLPK